jgi:hypothetical protein
MLLILLSASFAAVVEIGLATPEPISTAPTDLVNCGGSGWQAAYLCIGNVEKVVSSNGSTFYKPDGRIVSCPNAAPAQIGAECVQLLMPNYCPTELKCGVQVQNQSSVVSGNLSKGLQTPSVLASDKPLAPAPTAKVESIVIPVASSSIADFSMDSLALVVLLLGAVSVGVLFTMFKNSISE